MKILKKKKEIIELILFVLGLTAITYFKISDNKTNKAIFSDQGYAVGIVQQYDPGQNSFRFPQYSVRSQGITFSYIANEVQYSQNYGFDTFYIPSILIKKNDKYIVIYNLKKPEDARMLFDYPIRDMYDYNNYLKEFERNPPNLEHYTQ